MIRIGFSFLEDHHLLPTVLILAHSWACEQVASWFCVMCNGMYFSSSIFLTRVTHVWTWFWHSHARTRSPNAVGTSMMKRPVGRHHYNKYRTMTSCCSPQPNAEWHSKKIYWREMNRTTEWSKQKLSENGPFVHTIPPLENELNAISRKFLGHYCQAVYGRHNGIKDGGWRIYSHYCSQLFLLHFGFWV